MRRLVCLLALTSMFGTAPLRAQGLIQRVMSRLYGGPKVEAIMTTLCLTDMDGATSKMDVGGSVGGFVGLRMSDHFAIHEDILLHYKRAGLEQDGTKGDFEYIGAELTFYALGNWKLGNVGRLSFGIGPFCGYGLDAKYKVGSRETDLYEKDANGDKPLNPLNVGAAVTVGYELPCRLQVNASCKYGLMNMLDAGKDWEGMRPLTVGVGLAYRFGK